MLEKANICNFILETIRSFADEPVELSPNSVLLGKGSVLNSLMLVSLLVALEDFCAEHNIEFIWATDSAMSENRSQYRSIESLTEYIHGLSKLHGKTQ